MSAPTPYATCSRSRARPRACGKRSSTSAWIPTSIEAAPMPVNTPASAKTTQAPVNPWVSESGRHHRRRRREDHAGAETADEAAAEEGAQAVRERRRQVVRAHAGIRLAEGGCHEQDQRRDEEGAPSDERVDEARDEAGPQGVVGDPGGAGGAGRRLGGGHGLDGIGGRRWVAVRPRLRAHRSGGDPDAGHRRPSRRARTLSSRPPDIKRAR